MINFVPKSNPKKCKTTQQVKKSINQPEEEEKKKKSKQTSKAMNPP